MLQSTVKRKRVPVVNGLPIDVPREEVMPCWKGAHFDVDLLHLRLAEKAHAAVVRLTEGDLAIRDARYQLRDSSVKRVSRRFWGKLPFGYHMIRLHYGHGEYERKIVLRFVRESEGTFRGYLFNHPVRRSGAK
jgi:hypothetical protein